MRPKTPPFQPNESKEEREHKLRDFILAAIGDTATRRDDAVVVLARSPDSPVIRALLSLSGQLAARGQGAAIILAGGAVAAENETWNLVVSGDFVHEIRLTTNPRVLDGHEQLVVGGAAVWYGDSMRRDPWKRDAYAAFLADEPITADNARVTFARLWASGKSIYANSDLSSVIVSTSRSALESASQSSAPLEDETGSASTVVAASAGVTDSLEAWQPSTRH